MGLQKPEYTEGKILLFFILLLQHYPNVFTAVIFFYGVTCVIITRLTYFNILAMSIII